MQTYIFKTKKGEYEIKLYTPSEIVEYLDQYVIGNHEAKRVLAVTVYNHLKKIFLEDNMQDVELESQNLMIYGPTGCGKSFMLKLVSKLCNIPCAISDANELTASGFVGADISEVLVNLLKNADYDPEYAQIGIAVIDEIDKIARQETGASVTCDPGHVEVQQGLLKIIEGTIVNCPPQGGRRNPEAPTIPFDSRKTLFIGIGCFPNMKDIVSKRLKSANHIGFGSTNINTDRMSECELLAHACPGDFQEVGMIREFVGRFASFVNVVALNQDEMVKVLTDSKKSILTHYKILFLADNINLSFDESALQNIAYIATKMETGCRALKSIIECVMMEYTYNLSGVYTPEKPYDLTITYKDVESLLSTRFSAYM